MSAHKAAWVIATFLMTLTSTARADPFALKSTRTGNIQYVFVGAALADNTGLDNGVNCLLQTAQAQVTQSMLSANPNLVAATLYLSGSLIGDTLDYPVNNLALFTPGTNPSTGALEQAAQAAAAATVNFQPPGAAAPVTVSAAGPAYVTTYNIPSGSEAGYVGFFTTPIDVTQTIQGPGHGVLAGQYVVSSVASASGPAAGQVLADVCNGVEVICSSNSSVTCNNAPQSQVHDNGTASFGLLLIYEDLALPLYSISLFEGLQQLNGSTQTLNLVSGSPISNPASGALTYYVLEGDITFGQASAGTCGGDEYVQVSGGGTTLCLNDADNQVGNIFNGTINDANAAAPPNTAQCPNVALCCGPSLCGLAGIDIDRYDISAALAPGATEIDVTIGTGSDRVALASVVLGAQVFQALLSVDTQFRNFGAANNAAQVGGNIIYSLAISNTGNLDANNVVVEVDAPAGVTGFTVLSGPPGAKQTLSQLGANGTGQVTFSGFDVEVGKVQEVRFAATTQCAQLGQTLDVQAAISGANFTAFTVAAPTLDVGGPGTGACAGLDPTGPFSDVDPVRLLRGGGCVATPASLLLLALMILAWRHLRRARGALPILLLASLNTACGNQHPTAPATPSQNITTVTGLPGTACNSDLMLLVTPTTGNRFCIDRFEASLDGGSLGNAAQSSNDTSAALDGSTRAKAQVTLAVTPARNVSWYQAKAACQNAGKRLCAQSEWEFACRGAQGLDYPYGNTVVETTCNGFFQYNASNPAVTGSFKNCVSPSGVYDMSGNVAEWLDTAVSRLPDSTVLNDRATHGGSYASNDAAIACVGVQFHSAPATAAADLGFRCCMDAP